MSRQILLALGLLLWALPVEAQECPLVKIQPGDFLKWGATVLDSERLLWCSTESDTAACKTAEGAVRLDQVEPFGLADALDDCGNKWIVQRSLVDPFLIRKDKVIAIRWNPTEPAVAFLYVEGRRAPIRIPLGRPYCLAAAAVINFYSDAHAVPLCEPG